MDQYPIRVQSQLGQGTTFEVYLPRAEQACQVEERSPAHTHTASGGETILLVEDDTSVCELSRLVLGLHGYRLLEARDGQEAWQVACQYPEEIDLLLTDVIMPGMNGRALAEKLTGTRPDLKVLFMSGYSDDVVSQHGVLEPGTAFLPKPFQPADLALKVRTVLDDGH